jgi:hypothetical protein
MKRTSLAILLLAAVFTVGGCRLGAPVLESAGGANCGGNRCGPSKSQMLLRNWGRDARKQEQFIDQYFLNYDVNDPYRGDCLVGY